MTRDVEVSDGRAGNSKENCYSQYVALRNNGIEKIGSDYNTIRAFAFAMIVAETGMDPEEVRNLEMENIDPGP